jgi:uncharacterized membrane protein YeaQ/YmgE (transglycosylase-associated protein family)
MFIISFIVIGLIAGAIARLLVPGKDSLGIGATILLGMVGSLIGGFLGYLIFHKDSDNGLFHHRRDHRAADLPQGRPQVRPRVTPAPSPPSATRPTATAVGGEVRPVLDLRRSRPSL